MIIKEDMKWINWGKQKQAVLQVITRPIIPTEIMRKARRINNRISFGDTSALIREFERRGILQCITPEQLTGRIYFPTNYGRRLIWRIFAIEVPPIEENINWYKYSHIVAGKTRMLALKEMFSLQGFYPDGINLTFIRKRLNRTYPITLSQTFCAVKDLFTDKLIKVAGHAKKRNSKLYKLTQEGNRLCEYIQSLSQENHEHPF
jgi:DNA-binding HxlR family transcriptional regulator